MTKSICAGFQPTQEIAGCSRYVNEKGVSIGGRDNVRRNKVRTILVWGICT